MQEVQQIGSAKGASGARVTEVQEVWELPQPEKQRRLRKGVGLLREWRGWGEGYYRF